MATTQLKNESVAIYGLVDPITNECRYVGRAKHPERRLREHLTASNLKPKTHKNHWIRSVLAAGQTPEIFVIEKTSEESWQQDEQFWIEYFRSLGARLTNGAVGGCGGDTGPDGRKKQAAALRGRKRPFSEQHRKNLAAANREKAQRWAQDPEHRKIISDRMKRLWQTNRERMTAATEAGRKAPRTARYTMNCVLCGATFTTGTRKSRYCTRRCAVRAWKAGQRVEYRNV